MSAEAISYAWNAAVNASEKLVLLAMADNADEEWMCHYPEEELARKCGMELAELRGHIATLMRVGLLTLEAGHRRLDPSQVHGAVLSNLCNPRRRADRRIRKPSVRRRIFRRDGNACKACGAPSDLCLDHIVAVARGGSSEDENLQVLCRPCNSRKGCR